MRKFLDKYIYLSQPIMLFVTLMSNFVIFDFFVAGNIIGYSIITNVVFFYLFNYKGRYCWFTRNTPKFLLLINALDIIGTFIEYSTYNRIFNIAICSISLILFIIYKIKGLEK
jgi:hypothetical protein